MMDLPAQNPVPVKCCRVNWKPPDVTSLRTALKQSPATRLSGGHGKVMQSVGPWLDTLGLSGVGLGSHLKVWVWSMKRLHDLQKLKVQKVHSQVLPLPVEGEGCEDL